jgi:hypothetical protein
VLENRPPLNSRPAIVVMGLQTARRNLLRDAAAPACAPWFARSGHRIDKSVGQAGLPGTADHVPHHSAVHRIVTCGHCQTVCVSGAPVELARVTLELLSPKPISRNRDGSGKRRMFFTVSIPQLHGLYLLVISLRNAL